MRRMGASAFTLIEMLMVVAVIIILSGILLKITSLVTRNMARAKALHDLNQLKNALEEYYMIYGQYPPCSGVGYTHEGPKTRANASFGFFLSSHNNPNDPDNFFSDTALGYGYGLVSYLWPRERGGFQQHWYQKDTPNDVANKARWANYLKDIQIVMGDAVHSVRLDRWIVYTNACSTVWDPWQQDYQYISRPPYKSYKLWSRGPDKADGTEDDIMVDNEHF